MARILIVDDDPVLRAIAEAVLKDEGHEVVEADNGRTGVTLAAGGGFDLVLTDVLMPDTDGIELIRQLREGGSKIRILAMSSGGSYARKDVLGWAKAVGADAVLSKPLQKETLIAAVEALIGRAAPAPAGGSSRSVVRGGNDPGGGI